MQMRFVANRHRHPPQMVYSNDLATTASQHYSDYTLSEVDVTNFLKQFDFVN